MNYKQLIALSKANLRLNPAPKVGVKVGLIFDFGAKWMHQKLNESNSSPFPKFDSTLPFLSYGLLKYGLSLFVFFVSVFLFIKINVWLLPISIVIFYIVEVHFLFLFPVLLDKIENPLISSIKQTYKIGIYKALINVIPIGIYMVAGLFNFRNPFLNWYIGCLSIVIWYKHEIRDRL